MNRREFIIGCSVVAACAALPGEVMVAGVRYQSWPFGEPRPSEYFTGQIGGWGDYKDPRPLSVFMPRLVELQAHCPTLAWRPL
jgi:hypothetical protein